MRRGGRKEQPGCTVAGTDLGADDGQGRGRRKKPTPRRSPREDCTRGRIPDLEDQRLLAVDVAPRSFERAAVTFDNQSILVRRSVREVEARKLPPPMRADGESGEVSPRYRTDLVAASQRGERPEDSIALRGRVEAVH